MKRTLLGLLAVASGIACMAWGQDQPVQEEAPGRGVARISVMNGDVSVRRGDSGEVLAAALNAPLTVEDQLLTGPDSRAEVQFDSANMVRLAPLSEVRIAELENQRYQLQVVRGMVTFRVLRDSNAQVEISTPSVSVRPVQKGTYRIALREDGAAEISVRSGEADIFTPQGSERLPANRTMVARGTVSDPEFQVAQAVAYDDWDRWNKDRDRQLEGSRSYNYVSRDISGAEDLDRYGSWQNDPSYGDSWYPRVANDWAPYRAGRWSWVDWYGWNWVSNDPWGWAPYHFGRWFHTPERGWGWWPGDRYGRHSWSPGLVAFVGWDSWGGTRAGIGLVNNFDVTNGYQNARVRDALTGVDGRGFVNGRAGSAVRMNSGELGPASLVRGVLPMTPGRESLRLSDRAVGVNSLSQSRNGDRFVSRRQPARVDRVPFEHQRRGMDQMARRTFGDQRSPTVAGGLAGPGQGTSGVQRGAGDSGWRKFSEPRNTGQGTAGTPQSSQPNLHGGSVAPHSASPRYESPRTSSPQAYRGGGGSYSRPVPSGGVSSSSGGGRRNDRSR